MGCDIHMRAEVRKNNKWEIVGEVFPNRYYRPENELSEWNQPKTAEPYGGRNYDLFAILADVRNGRGFAGIKTGEGFVPISEPKGIPEDASEEAKEFLNSYGGDGHSHSFFTVSELMAYDWEQKTGKQGYVTIEEYKNFKENGHPEAWCGGVDGGGVSKITNEEMDEILKSGNTQPDTYTLVKWRTSYRDSVGDYFLVNTMDELKKLGEPENVRIVFFFDN